MPKNIVYIIATPKNGVLAPEYKISINAWSTWAKKNDVDVFLLSEPIVDTSAMHIIWQRYYMFDLFDANGIEANQVLIVDADTIPHPDCPNFFNETENKYCLIHDDGSYDWILRGMEHYAKNIFVNEWFPFYEYGNSGFQVVNNSHREFFNAMKELYYNNHNEIRYIQKQFGIGTDQTPLNFMLRKHNIDVKLLPYKYNMTCMLKKEILDEQLSFIDCGWVYHFNGLPNKETSVLYWMNKTYNALYG